MELFFVFAGRFTRLALLLSLTAAFLLGGKLPAPVLAAPAPEPEQEVVHAPSYAPVARVILDVPADVMVGEDFTFTATFDNLTGTDAGYGPFIDIVFPVTGADGAGAAPDDGVDFLGATYLGSVLTAVQNTFGAANTGGCSGGLGPVTHPYAVALTTGTPLVVCGVPGDRLVTLQLPFGSFVPSQPPAMVNISAHLSDLADVGTALTIRARGGYQFGATALNDWCCGDATLLTPAAPDSTTWPGRDMTPVIASISKTYSGPEDETATGPNFLRRYTVSVDIAAGQTVTDLLLTDTLPNTIQYSSFIASTPAGCTLTGTPSTATPGGVLTCRFDSVTGGAGENDASFTFEFYVPLTDAGGGRVIDPNSGADRNMTNAADFSGNWTPIDTRDAIAPVSAVCPNCHSLAAKSIAIQKQLMIRTDAGYPGYSPGDTVEYTLNFQVSDFFAFDQVDITDILSDGQRLDASLPLELTVNGNPFAFGPVSMSGSNVDVSCNYTAGPGPECDSDDPAANDGRTTIVFDVSTEISDHTATDRLIGGCVNPAGGSAIPDCGAYQNGPTTGTIVYRAVVQDRYSDDYPSGDPSVDHGDVMSNHVTISGRLLDTGTLMTLGPTESDTSGSDLVVEFGSVQKAVYALNGDTSCGGSCANVRVRPGDRLTYRIQYTQPSSDFEPTNIDDYLPLPVFLANDPDADGAAGPAWSYDSTAATTPPAGQWKYGPADTLHLDPPAGPDPVVSVEASNNRLRFAYPAFDDPANRTSQIDLLFSLTVSSEPFADLLMLTNQVHVTEGTTQLNPIDTDAIVQITLTEPVLTSKKGVVATDSSLGTFNPGLSAPFFNAPGTGSPGGILPRWIGTISSANVANIATANLSGVDAGDRVTFAIVIENAGMSASGAFDITIQDVLQTGYVIPAGGINLHIANGDNSTAFTFTGLGGGPDGSADTEDDIFGAGIRIDDPNEGTATPFPGACQAHHATSGHNILVLTYDLQIADDVTPNQGIINTASLLRYAGSEGGPNHLSAPLTDTATVTPFAAPTKSITVTSETHTGETTPRLAAVGEIVRFRIVESIPEGILTNFRLHDALPAGLIFLDDSTARMVFVSNDSIAPVEVVTSSTLSGVGLNVVGNETTVPAVTPGFVLPDPAVSATDSTSTTNYAANDNDTYGSGTDIYFKFGTITNPDRDPDMEYVILEFNAIVANIAGNTAGVNRANSATSRYGSSLTDSSASPTVQVRVVEPSITFGKTILSLPSPLDAGGVVQYRLSFANGMGANVSDAFDVHLTDTLPAQLQLDLASINVTLAGGAAGPTNASAGNGIDITVASVPRGGSVTVDYSATILDTVTPGEIITNTSTGTWTSLPGSGTTPNAAGSTAGTAGGPTGERIGTIPVAAPNNYTATRTASFQIHSDPLFSKTIEHTDVLATPDPDTVIGEIVTFGLLVTLPEGTTPSLHLVDDLPGGMAYFDDAYPYVLVTTHPPAACGSLAQDFGGTVPAPALTVTPAAGGDSAMLTFDFGTITVADDNNPDNNSFLICFQAVVENLAGNQTGTGLTNLGTAQIGAGNIVTGNETVNVVEPVLQIEKAVDELFPIPGQVLNFILTIDHAAASTANAYDVIVFDDLPANLTLDLASVTTSIAGAVSGVADHSAGNRVEVWVDAIPDGASLTVRFQATFTGALGDSLTNTGNVTWTSKPGADSNERQSGGGVDDYAASDDLGLADTRELVKSLVATNHPNTSLPDVAIGELLAYQVVLTIPAASTDTAIVIDTLDAGLAFVSCSQITAGPGITSSTVDFAAIDNCHPGTTLADNPQVSDSGRVIRFDLGTVTNSNPAATETITITYQTAVLDVLTNTGGVQLVNEVEWRWNTTSLRAAAPQVTIRESDLSLDKTVDPQVALPGAPLTYSLTIEHTGQSAADAFDLLLTDVLPDGLEFPGGAPAVTTASGQAPDVVNYEPLTRTLTVRWNSFLLGAQSEVEVSARLLATLNRGTSITNEASLEWSSLPGDISAPQSIFNAASTERRYDPLNPADIYIVNSSALVTVPALPRTGFAPGQLTALAEQPDDFAYNSLGDLWLEIPRLNLKVNVVGVPFKSQKDWNLTWLGSQAGYLEGTAYPTHAGNSGITAHAYLADGSPGPFVDLNKLSYGDQIIVHLGGQHYIYEVRENKLVRPNDLSVLGHEKYPWLTLLTCKSYNEYAGEYLFRVSVRAVLVKVENE